MVVLHQGVTANSLLAASNARKKWDIFFSRFRVAAHDGKGKTHVHVHGALEDD